MSHYGGYKCPEFEEYCQREARKRKAAKWAGGGIIAILIGLMLLFAGCKEILPLIQREEVVTRYVDSTIWHTDTSYFEVPVEVYKDYTSLLDTLRLETNYAYTWSAVDTNNHILIGELRNKAIKLPVEYKWKERIIYQDTTIFKEKEIKVPVEKEVIKTKIPWWALITLTWTLLCLVYVGFKIYLKIYKP